MTRGCEAGLEASRPKQEGKISHRDRKEREGKAGGNWTFPQSFSVFVFFAAFV